VFGRGQDKRYAFGGLGVPAMSAGYEQLEVQSHENKIENFFEQVSVAVPMRSQ
jgi:hypothetical protein